jgi:hypothetical protein
MTKSGPVTSLVAVLLLACSVGNASAFAPAPAGDQPQAQQLPQASAAIDLLAILMSLEEGGKDIENRPPPPPLAASFAPR